MEKNLMEFKCTMIKERFNSDNYKIYVVDVNREIYSNIKGNKKDEIVLVGNIPNLLPNLEYKIQAYIEVNKNWGLQYSVKSIRQDKATDLESSRKFLNAIINPNYVDILLEVYPNIIDKIIKNDLEDIDLNKTKGIKDATFFKIKQAVIENFALIELVDLFNGLISINVIKKLYEKYTSVKIVKKQIQLNPYKCLCNLSRIGFKSADKILLELDRESKNKEDCQFSFAEDLLTSKQRMKACINFILEENESKGNTRISIQDLRKESNVLTPECINHFVDIIKENDEDIHVDNDLKCISSTRAIKTENYIAQTLLNMKKNSFVWNINTELYRESDGFIITDEQMQTLNMMCINNIGILTAPGGSGKTASVKNFLNMLNDNNKTYMLCTPTGKSSEVLAEQTNREAGTIHRQLKFNPKNENPWTFNEQNKLPVDVVIVDEFSMVDIYLFKHLLEAIDITKTKLLLVFDSYQLPSVGCGNIAQDLLDSDVIPITRLTKIFRYNEGGLMQVVTKIRNSEEFLNSEFTGVKIFGTKKDFIFVELQQQQIVNQLLKIYTKLMNDGFTINDIMVLSSQNKGDYGTKAINKSVQYMLQKNKKNRFIITGDNKFFNGDKVIQVVNNYKATTPLGEETEIFNGNTGVIVEVNWETITVDFGKGKYIVYTKSELSQLELGYCISIHRSQGDASKQIICITPKSHNFMLNSNLLYVAGTRARERVYMLGNIITVNRAIKKKENLQRNTWLCDLLKLAS
jgi:exodeoxyribonuclease V alpha subunit